MTIEVVSEGVKERHGCEVLLSEKAPTDERRRR
jgi:hypothetical protein